MKKSGSSITSGDARRLAIMESALTCFLRHGYAKTSLDDISKAAGLSRSLLYLAFDNKEDIFRAVFHHLVADAYGAAKVLMAQPANDKKATIFSIYKILLINPYSRIIGAPMVADFYETCRKVLPEPSIRHEKLVRKYMTALFGDKTVADVFARAVVGLFQDLPSAAVLESRLRVLTDHFSLIVEGQQRLNEEVNRGSSAPEAAQSS